MINERQAIEDSIDILKNQLDEIYNVNEWANKMGYTRGHFSYLVKKEFDQTPSKIIRCEKFRELKRLIKRSPKKKGHVLANAVGFADVKLLYQFLHRHFDTSLTILRIKLEKRK